MAEKDDKSKRPAAGKWHAVHIAAGPKACDAVLALAKKRFLSSEAPRLPLAECPRPGSCQCGYRHHKDRRSGPRRWSDQGGGDRAGAHTSERRAVRGRRSED